MALTAKILYIGYHLILKTEVDVILNQKCMAL